MFQFRALRPGACCHLFVRPLPSKLTSVALLLAIGLVTQLVCLRSSWAADLAARPNIVLIMADDLGFSDLGCYGSEIETPNLDALAEQGLQLTQFYNTAKCHSSRVSLLSGLWCDQAGAESLSRGTTIAERLRSAGYFTAMAGKWHLHDQPTDHGFDRYFGHLSGATNFFTGDNTFRLNGEPWDDFDKDFYTTIADTDYAIDFVDEGLATGKPLFLYVAYNAPHYPLQALREDFEKYQPLYQVGWDVIREKRFQRQQDMKLFTPGTVTNLGRPSYIPAWDDLSAEDRRWEADRMAAFAGMVDCMDREIGRLVDHLKAKNAFENTLFVFVSDNGACPFERTKGKHLPPYDSKSYWTYDTGWAHVGNTPFRYYKQNNHEGGIASPAIIHWPAGLERPAGSVDATPGHLVDLMPTCLEVAGSEYPEKLESRKIEPLVGRSLEPLISGGKVEPREYLYFHFSSNRALRMGDWKVVSHRSGPWELYNLAADRNEAHNLATAEPGRLERLADKWHQVAKDLERLPPKQLAPVSEKPQHDKYQKDGKQ